MTYGMKSSNNERFYLTEEGIKSGKIIYKKLSSNQRKIILNFRLFWDEKKLIGLMKYIYANYDSFTKESVILKNLFPGRKLYRRRG